MHSAIRIAAPTRTECALDSSDLQSGICRLMVSIVVLEAGFYKFPFPSVECLTSDVLA
jgi:hypothetical protein